MRFSDDFKYISATEKELINKGYGKLTVHSIHFDRFVSDEEIEKNRTFDMNSIEWTKHCDDVWSKWSEAGYRLMDMVSEKYNVYQYNGNYDNDYQLFFCSNKGWNGKDYMTGFSLTFNSDKSVEYNMELLNNLKLFLSDCSDTFTCRVQYDTAVDWNSLDDYVKANIGKIKDKMVSFGVRKGKVKCVGYGTNNSMQYGFFRKGARKYYTPLSSIDIYKILTA